MRARARTFEESLATLCRIRAIGEKRVGVARSPLASPREERAGVVVSERIAEPLESLVDGVSVAVVALRLDEAAHGLELIIERANGLPVALLREPPKGACKRRKEDVTFL